METDTKDLNFGLVYEYFYKEDFQTEDKRICLNKGDLISEDEYYSLSLEERTKFKQVLKKRVKPQTLKYKTMYESLIMYSNEDHTFEVNVGTQISEKEWNKLNFFLQEGFKKVTI